MSVVQSPSVYLLLTAGLIATTPARNAYAQTNTGTRPAAKPKAVTPTKQPQVRKPAPAQQPQGTFSVPDLGNDSWYNLDGAAVTQLSDSGAKSNQVGLVGVVNYFGAGFGVEYVRSFAPFGIAISGLYTSANLEDKLTSSGQNQDEAKEFFDTRSSYLRVHGRYNFLRYVYASAGATFDRISGTYGWRGTAIMGEEIKADFTSALTMFDLMIGSEFRGPWGSYFGVDWLGTSFPINSTIKYEDNSDLNVTSLALKGARPEQRIDDETTAQLRIYYLNIRIGITF